MNRRLFSVRWCLLLLAGPLTTQVASAQLRIVHGTLVSAGGSASSSKTSVFGSAGQAIVDPTGQIPAGFIPASGGATATSIESVDEALPAEFRLHSNYPNPFNPVTTLRFDLVSQAMTRLEVFDTLGRSRAVLVNEDLSPGSYEVLFDAAGFTSGLYLYRLTTGAQVAVGRMILLK
jgi:Secretion system C-terminal sorting domain